MFYIYLSASYNKIFLHAVFGGKTLRLWHKTSDRLFGKLFFDHQIFPVTRLGKGCIFQKKKMDVVADRKKLAFQ